jgi:tRNA(Ile)-lysidine synthase
MSSTAETDRLETEVLSCLLANGARPGATVVAACSGGPDSTALLHALVAVSLERGLCVVCAYLDHGIRGEAERAAEGAAVAALARRCAVPLERGSLAAGELQGEAARLGSSLEELARDRRYRFLEAVADARGAGLIALGHTEDDAVETVLMRVLQGVDVSGLAGIPQRRGRCVRPLYRVSRAEVIAYLEHNGLDYVTDSSNADPRYLRNRVRAELLPAVSRVFPSYRRSLLELARKAGQTNRYIREASRELVRWRSDGAGVSAPWPAFASADGVLRVESAYAALDQLGAGRIPHRFLEPLRGDLRPDRHGVILAGCGYRFVRRGGSVHAEPDVVRRRKIGYLLRIRSPGEYAIPGCGIVARVAGCRPDGDGGSAVPAGPMVLRSPRPGDRVSVRGRPLELRRLAAGCPGSESAWDRVPVVADRRGVALVLGSAVGCRDAAADRVPGEARLDPGISLEVVVEDL